jgi:hypothetical protein
VIPKQRSGEASEETVGEKATGMKGRMMEKTCLEKCASRPSLVFEPERVSQYQRAAHSEAVKASGEPNH